MRPSVPLPGLLGGRNSENTCFVCIFREGARPDKARIRIERRCKAQCVLIHDEEGFVPQTRARYPRRSSAIVERLDRGSLLKYEARETGVPTTATLSLFSPMIIRLQNVAIVYSFYVYLQGGSAGANLYIMLRPPPAGRIFKGVATRHIRTSYTMPSESIECGSVLLRDEISLSRCNSFIYPEQSGVPSPTTGNPMYVSITDTLFALSYRSPLLGSERVTVSRHRARE